MLSKFPFKTDALQLGPNATSPCIYRTIDNKLVFFDQSVGEILLKDIVPSSDTSPQKLLNSITALSNHLDSINTPKQQDDSFFSFLSPSSSSSLVLDKSYNHIFGTLNSSLASLSISDSLLSIIENVSFTNTVSISSSNDTPTRNVIFRNCSFSVSAPSRFVSSSKTNLYFQNCSFSGPGTVYSSNFKQLSLSSSSPEASLSLDLRHNPALFQGGSVSLDASFSSLYASNCSVYSASPNTHKNPSITLDNSSLSYASLHPIPLSFNISCDKDKKSSFLPLKGYSGIFNSTSSSVGSVSLPAPLPHNNYIVLFETSQSLSLAHQTQPLVSQAPGTSNSITLSSSAPIFVSNKTTSSFSFNFPQGPQFNNISFSWLLLLLG